MALEKVKQFIRTASYEELTNCLENYGIELEDIVQEKCKISITKQIYYNPNLESTFSFGRLENFEFMFGEDPLFESLGQSVTYSTRLVNPIKNQAVCWVGKEVA